MDPNGLPAIGKKPKIKVILVKQTLDELQGLLDDNWKIAISYPHANGAIFLMAKDV